MEGIHQMHRHFLVSQSCKNGTQLNTQLEPPLTVTSEKYPPAIKRPRRQVRIETVKQPLKNDHLSTSYNEQLSSRRLAKITSQNEQPHKTAENYFQDLHNRKIIAVARLFKACMT